MANTIRLKRSPLAGKAPAVADLQLGELAINTTDGKLYLKKSDAGEFVVEVGPVTSVAGRTGAVTLAKADVGLSSVDNTSDAAKPVSTATQAALSGKANSTHNHVIADVTNLQSTLDAKAASIHAHGIADVTGLQTALDGKQPAGSYAAATHSHSAATASVSGFLSSTDKAKLDGIAAGAVNPGFATQVEAEAGADNAKIMTALRVAQAIFAQGMSGLSVDVRIYKEITLVSLARVANVVTATTNDTHNMTVGATVVLRGASTSAFNGTFTITSVTATTIRWAQVAADATSAVGSARLRQSSAFTWTKPANAEIIIGLVSGGGGAGSADTYSSTTTMCGTTVSGGPGAGGGGGGGAFFCISADSTAASVTITLGGPNGTSSFGTIATATGGSDASSKNGGGGGSASSPSGVAISGGPGGPGQTGGVVASGGAGGSTIWWGNATGNGWHGQGGQGQASNGSSAGSSSAGLIMIMTLTRV